MPPPPRRPESDPLLLPSAPSAATDDDSSDPASDAESESPEFDAALTASVPPAGHEPVLLREVLELLNPQPGQVILDCTLGRGGHAQAVAQRLGPTGTLIGVDADPRNLEFA